MYRTLLFLCYCCREGDGDGCKQRAVHCIFNENELRTHDTNLGQARCGTYLSNENLGFTHANNIPRGLRANKMTSKERVIYAKCKA